MNLKALGDTARFINGAAFKPTDWCDGGLPIIRIQNLTGTGDKFNYTSRQVKPELVVEPGDLLVSWSATLDVYRWGGPRGLLNQHIFKVLPKPGIDPDYLYYALKSALAELSSKTHGSTMKHVVRGDFESTRVRIPSLPEQHRIVDLLSRAEGIVRLRREAEKKANELIPALFAERFGTGTDSSVSIQRLADICSKITDGAHKTPTYVDSGIPFLRVCDIQDMDINWAKAKKIPVDEHRELTKRCKPERGDILYSKNGTIGIAKEITWDSEFSTFVSLALIKPKRDIAHSTFLTTFLNTPFALKQARDRTKTGTVQNLHLEEIREIKVPLPPMELQIAFVEQAMQVRSIEAQQAAARAKAKATFDALLAQSFR